MSKRRERETSEYINDFLKRAIKGAGKRVANGDPADLAELVAMRNYFDEVLVEAVRGMRETHGYSWAQIARELGMGSRQAAQQAFGERRRVGAGA